MVPLSLAPTCRVTLGVVDPTRLLLARVGGNRKTTHDFLSAFLSACGEVTGALQVSPDAVATVVEVGRVARFGLDHELGSQHVPAGAVALTLVRVATSPIEPPAHGFCASARCARKQKRIWPTAR